MQPVRLLDHGYVELVRMMPETGADKVVVDSARISTGKIKDSYDPVNDPKLIRYLLKHGHTSVFEHVIYTFKIKCPIYVKNHFVRHRTAKFNEISQRYSEVRDEFFHPSTDPQYIRSQSKSNRQSSTEMADQQRRDEVIQLFQQSEQLIQQQFDIYQKLVGLGVARETARFALPLATYTEFVFTMDLHNLMHFLRLRCADDTQYETRLYAKAMYDLVRDTAPACFEAFEDYVIGRVSFSKSVWDSVASGQEFSGSQSDNQDYKRLKSIALS